MIESMENSLNTIKAHHIKIINGVLHIGKKEYYWHIPKHLRAQDIENGDFVVVTANGKRVKVIVSGVFRENLEDTGKRYKRVLKKLILSQFDTNCQIKNNKL